MRGSAFEAERDLVRVGGWRNAEVVFELSLIAVVNEVDAGVNRLILHAGELRNVAVPLGGIVANEIAALARQKRSARNAGRRVCSVKVHPNDRTRCTLRTDC